MKLFLYLVALMSLSSCLHHEENPEIHQDNIGSHVEEEVESIIVEETPIHQSAQYIDIPEKEFSELLSVLPIPDTTKFSFYNKKYITPQDTFWVVQAYYIENEWEAHFDIYLLQKQAEQFRIKLQTEIEKEVFDDHPRIYDTIMDVNFDGREDYMTYYYSGVGCCPRDSRDVYLNKTNGFSEDVVELFNPGFDTANHFVLEMGYGHVPYLSITKSIWDGDSLREIEHISHNMTYTDTILRYHDGGTYVIGYEDGSSNTIDEIPEEYYFIPAMAHWFAGRVDEGSLNN